MKRTTLSLFLVTLTTFENSNAMFSRNRQSSADEEGAPKTTPLTTQKTRQPQTEETLTSPKESSATPKTHRPSVSNLTNILRRLSSTDKNPQQDAPVSYQKQIQTSADDDTKLPATTPSSVTSSTPKSETSKRPRFESRISSTISSSSDQNPEDEELAAGLDTLTLAKQSADGLAINIPETPFTYRFLERQPGKLWHNGPIYDIGFSTLPQENTKTLLFTSYDEDEYGGRCLRLWELLPESTNVYRIGKLTRKKSIKGSRGDGATIEIEYDAGRLFAVMMFPDEPHHKKFLPLTGDEMPWGIDLLNNGKKQGICAAENTKTSLGTAFIMDAYNETLTEIVYKQGTSFKEKRENFFTNRYMQNLQIDPREISIGAISTDTKLIAAGTFEGTLRVWTLYNAHPIQLFEHKAHNAQITAVAFANKDILITAGEDGSLCVWNLGGSLLEPSGSLRRTGSMSQRQKGRRKSITGTFLSPADAAS